MKYINFLVIGFIIIFKNASVFSQTTDTYTSGTTVWTVPACVFTVTVRAWGAGGAGGGARATDRNGGGGGGGAYSTIVNYTVTPGQQLSIAVGAGGVGSAGNAGPNGGASSVTLVSGSVVICSAAGGIGGSVGANATSSGIGGNGGSVASNIPAGVGFSGGRGGNSNANTSTSDQSGGGGGGAGSAGNGGNGGNNGGAGGTAGAGGGGTGGAGLSTTSNTGSPGNPGNLFGGGGSGATCFNSGTRAGGNGARGQVEITYTVGPCCPPPATPTGITGATDPCYNTTQNYSVVSALATNFIWDVPADWTILSGSGTNTISVLVGIGGGNVSVQPENSCTTLSPTLLPVTVCAASVPSPNQIYTVPGTYSWTVPACVTNVIVQAWGAGGGGGGVASFINGGIGFNEACSGGGGGGGGGFTSRTYDVVPGQTYTIVVGAGGVSGVGVSGGTSDVVCCNGGTGGNSTFSGPATVTLGTLTAFGGSGGVGAKTYNNNCGCHEGFNGTGGAGGINVGTNGTASYVGGDGAMGRHSASCFDQSGGGGAGAGSTGNGGNATTLTGCPVGSRAGGVGTSGGNGANGILGTICTGCAPNYSSTAGTAIGGGGNGALTHVNEWLNSWVLRNGGVGARGEVRLTYFDCPLPINLVNFSGFAINNSNKLIWSIENSKDLQSFIIEKSTDGNIWSTINETPIKLSDKEFSYLDINCENDQITYYKLSSLEISGNINKYSRIIEVFRNFNKIEVIKIVNSLGQEVTEDYRGVVYKYLKNGQVERLIQE